MHFSAEQVGEVKAWMVKKLEDISDADPEILTDYCVAILESEATDEEIRKTAIENLEDFLKDHTVNFVDEIFARYAPKSAPSMATAHTKPTATNVGKQLKDGLPIQSYESAPFGGQNSSEKFNTGRKRSYNDAYGHGQEMQYGDGNGNGNGVSSKPSRPKRDRRDARTSGRGLSSRQLPSPVAITSNPFMNAPPPPTPPPGFPAFDPADPMAAFAFMQAMFPQMAGMLPPLPNGEVRTFGNTPRCQDYDTKGYCTLGSSCPYEHGRDLVVAPADDEYDPTRANFSMNGAQSGASRAGSRTQRTRRLPGSLGRSDAKWNNRAAFSDPRRPADKTFTSIVVEQIPEEHFADETVRSFFSQYGKVLDITMEPYKHLAIVKYDTHASAQRAWESSKAVFENRFVKVYWYRPDLETANMGHGTASAPKDIHASMNTDTVAGEAFRDQQQEKQKAYEERMRIRKAMEDAREDLVRRRGHMAKEREALATKLAIAEGDDGAQLNANGTKSPHNGVATESPDPKIKALREQLARMQAEAKRLGIDPDAPPDDLPNASSGQYRTAGGLIHRNSAARAANRGYGPPRGSYRGHGFVRGRDPSVNKLDNRPKSIAICGVDFDHVKEENLRSYLTLIGSFEDIELDPGRTDARIIVFTERWQAEQVMHGRSDIPGVGKVELSWVARTANGTAAQTAEGDEDAVLGEAGDDAWRTLGDEAHPVQDDNLDVAGGDDDDWGNNA